MPLINFACTFLGSERTQSAWGRQRDNYLDNLMWTNGNTVAQNECSGYTSHLERLNRVENLCKKDPCATSRKGFFCFDRIV